MRGEGICGSSSANDTHEPGGASSSRVLGAQSGVLDPSPHSQVPGEPILHPELAAGSPITPFASPTNGIDPNLPQPVLLWGPASTAAGDAYNPYEMNNPECDFFDFNFAQTIPFLQNWDNPLSHLEHEPHAPFYVHPPDVFAGNYQSTPSGISSAYTSPSGMEKATELIEGFEAIALNLLENLHSQYGATFTVRSGETFGLADFAWLQPGKLKAALYVARALTACNALHAGLVDDKRECKRGLYYFAPGVHQDQGGTDRLLMTFGATLGVNHHLLGIRAAPKAAFSGQGITVQNEHGVFTHSHFGEQSLPNLYFCKSIQVFPTFHWMVFVEKYAFFSSIYHLANDFGAKEVGHGMVVSVRGMSDFATRLFGHEIDRILPPHVPMITLVDLDAPGLGIASVLANGSAGELDPKPIGRLVYMGITWDDLETYDVRPEHRLPMTETQLEEAKAVQNRPGVSRDPLMVSVLDKIIKTKTQVSMGALEQPQREQMLFDKIRIAQKRQKRLSEDGPLAPRQPISRNGPFQPLYTSTTKPLIPLLPPQDNPIFTPEFLEKCEPDLKMIEYIGVALDQAEQIVTRRNRQELVEQITPIFQDFDEWAESIVPFLTAKGVQNMRAGVLYMMEVLSPSEVINYHASIYKTAIKSVLDAQPDGYASEDTIVNGVFDAHPEFQNSRHNIHQARIRALLVHKRSPFQLLRMENGNRIYHFDEFQGVYWDPVVSVFTSLQGPLTVNEVSDELTKTHPTFVAGRSAGALNTGVKKILKHPPFRLVDNKRTGHRYAMDRVESIFDDPVADEELPDTDNDAESTLPSTSSATNDVDTEMDAAPNQSSDVFSYQDAMVSVFASLQGPLTVNEVSAKLIKMYPIFVAGRSAGTLNSGVRTTIRRPPFRLVDKKGNEHRYAMDPVQSIFDDPVADEELPDTDNDAESTLPSTSSATNDVDTGMGAAPNQSSDVSYACSSYLRPVVSVFTSLQGPLTVNEVSDELTKTHPTFVAGRSAGTLNWGVGRVVRRPPFRYVGKKGRKRRYAMDPVQSTPAGINMDDSDVEDVEMDEASRVLPPILIKYNEYGILTARSKGKGHAD